MSVGVGVRVRVGGIALPLTALDSWMSQLHTSPWGWAGHHPDGILHGQHHGTGQHFAGDRKSSRNHAVVVSTSYKLSGAGDAEVILGHIRRYLALLGHIRLYSAIIGYNRLY